MEKKTLAEAAANLKKKYGYDVVMEMDKNKDFKVDTISTGCFSLDAAFGNGIPKGRIIEVFGEESCLVGSTFIPFHVRDREGKIQNSKGGTIERLYERFHGINSGQGKYQRKETVGSNFYVSSINETDNIVKNLVVDVVKTGEKECFCVTTEGGKKITTTKEHKYYVGYGNYLPLSDLTVGSEIYMHNNTPFKGRAPQIRYKEVLVKYHPSGHKKVVNGYTYYRVKKSHIVYEANENLSTVEEYIKFLNSKNAKTKKFYTVPKGMHIHHKNHNPLDDRLENLFLMTSSQHNRLHALDNDNKLRFIATTDIIKSIVHVGKKMTYDIKCLAPYNNYVANNFVVHNSGKSTLSQFIIAQLQKSGGKAALIDVENAFDGEYAKNIGVKVDELLVAQPATLEESFDVVKELVETNEVDIIVVDSVAALVPKSEAEGEEMLKDSMAVQARLMSKALRILTGPISKSKTIVIFINQTRDKVGVMFGKKETTPGGKALKFFASIRVEVKKGEAIKDSDGKQIGNWLKATMVKNKVGFPWQKAEFELYYAKGIDLHGDALDYGEQIGVIAKSGNSYSFGETKLGNNRGNAKNKLASDEELYQKVRKAIDEKILSLSKK